MLNSLVESMVSVLWSTPMVFVVLAVGVLFTIRMAAPQIVRAGEMARLLVGGGGSDQGVSSFQAFAMALGGRIGVGNIAGVATAIHFGGPGAMFWMWATAVLGSAVSVAECSLGQVWKEEINGEYRGGPAYYIQHGIGWRWLAVLYAVAALFAFGVTGPSIQAFNIAESIDNAWGLDPRITGVIVTLLFLAVVLGGLKRIGAVCGLVVPFMAAGYILLGLVILAMNASAVPAMFALIFRSAFGAESVFGGMLGATIMWGVRRAIYSSEAGTGSSAQAAAAAEVSHPVKQGLAQGFSIYVDTLFVCTITGLIILVTNRYNVANPDGSMIVQYAPGLIEGPAYTQAAIDAVFPGLGSAFVAIAMFFFAFTTLLSFAFYADTNIAFLVRSKRWERRLVLIIQFLIAASILLGSFRSSTFAWNLADIGVGLYTWINLVALVLLRGKAVAVFRDYVRQKKEGLDPVFDPEAIGIMNAPVWREISRRTASARDRSVRRSE